MKDYEIKEILQQASLIPSSAWSPLNCIDLAKIQTFEKVGAVNDLNLSAKIQSISLKLKKLYFNKTEN